MIGHKLRVSVAAIAVALLFAVPGIGVAQQVDELHNKLPDSIKASGIVRVGSPRTIAPQVFLEGDKLVGIAVDLATAMEPILGVKFEWIDMQWPGIIPGLQGGSIDASMGIISFKQDRKDILNMIPFVQDQLGYLVPAGVEGVTEDPQSLCGRPVGAIQGSIFTATVEAEGAKCVANGKANIDLKQFASNAAVIAAFQAKNIDAWAHTTIELHAAEENLGEGAQLYLANGWSLPPSTISTSIDQKELAEAILGALHILVDNGEYATILTRYGNGDGALDKAQIAINP